MFGSFFGGSILKAGRRRAHIIACIVGIVGVLLTMVEQYWALLVGRIIFGVACGFQCVAGPRYIEEYVPIKVYSIAGPSFAFSQNIGILIALSGGALLPPDTAPAQEILDSNSWRILFAIPIPFYLLILVSMLFFYQEPPKFLLNKGDIGEAEKSIKKIYKVNTD